MGCKLTRMNNVLSVFKSEEPVLEKQNHSQVSLHEAIIRDNSTLCENILQDPNFKINSPLIYFHRPGLFESRLLKSDINFTALHIAAIYRRPKIISLLLKYGADPNLTDKLGRSSLYLTMIYWPRLQFYRDFSKLPKEEIHYREYVKQLHIKSEHCLKELLRYGANVNNFSDSYHRTALHIAAQYNIILAVPLLLQHGANLEATNSANERTPLLVAASMGHVYLIKLLIRSGANIFATDNRKMNILHFMASSYVDINVLFIHRLLDQGINLNGKTAHRGDSPLHIAAAVGNEVMIHLLLERGANPDILNRAKQSILFVYLNRINCSCNFKLIQCILNETSQVKIVDIYGDLPREIQKQHRERLKNFLINLSTCPSPLQHLCKCIIRKKIGLTNLVKKTLNNLVYPQILKDYICSNYYDNDEFQ